MTVQSETIFQRHWVCPNPACHGVADEATAPSVTGFAPGAVASPVIGLAGQPGRTLTSGCPASPPFGDEVVSFTTEELQQMETDGLTLADAIRTIESRPG